MARRQDFKGAQDLVERLKVYSKEFFKYNKRWERLKRDECFREIYQFSDDQRLPIEDLYAKGRGFACAMHSLFDEEMEDISRCPTFVSYVDHVEKEFPKYLRESVPVIAKAEEIISDSKYFNSDVAEMIQLYKDQVNINKGLGTWISQAKNTKLYKEESGDFGISVNHEVTEGDKKRVSKSSEYLRRGDYPDMFFYAKAKGLKKEYKLKLSPNTQAYMLLQYLYNNYGPGNSTASVEDLLIACNIKKHNKGERVCDKKIKQLQKLVSTVRSELYGAELKGCHLKFEVVNGKVVNDECRLLVHCKS